MYDDNGDEPGRISSIVRFAGALVLLIGTRVDPNLSSGTQSAVRSSARGQTPWLERIRAEKRRGHGKTGSLTFHRSHPGPRARREKKERRAGGRLEPARR